MIGSLDPSVRSVTIVGGGIAGLLAAHRLSKLGWEVTLHEKSPRLGGLLHTEQLAEGIAEGAAHSLLATSPVDALFRELAVPLKEVKVDSKARYIFHEGRSRRFPLGFAETLGTLQRALFAKAPQTENQTLAEWAATHLGPAALERLIVPFALGIFGARPDELLLKDAFPKLVVQPGRTLFGEFLRRNRSKKRPRLVAPSGGMGSFVQALEDSLRARANARIHTGSEITSLPAGSNRILAVDARSAAKLIGPTHPALASLLDQVPHSPLVSVTAFIESASLRKPVRGVGVLVPEGVNTRALGILFNSSAFPGRVARDGLSSFTILFGGTRDPMAVKWDESEIATQSKQALELLVGLRKDARILRLVPHAYACAVPIYGPALLAAREEAKRAFEPAPGTVLFANWTGAVSLRGMIESSASWMGV